MGETARGLLRSAAGLLMTIGLALGAFHYTKFGTDHPYLTREVAFFFFLGAAALAIFWMLSGEKEKPQESALSAPRASTVGSENETTQVSAQGDASAGTLTKANGDVGGSQIGRDAYLLGDEALRALQRFPNPPKEVVAPKSSLRVIGIDSERVSPAFPFYLDRSSPLYYLVVENDCAQDGRRTSTIESLKASLEFLGLSDSLHHVDACYWKDKNFSHISISPGGRESVLLGQMRDGWWFYYKNPNRQRSTMRNRTLESDRDEEDNLHWRNFAIPGDCGMKITLFSAADGLVKGQVIIHLTVGDGKTPSLRIQDEA